MIRKIDITMLGCGSAFNHSLGNTAALMCITCDDDREYRILIDCGHDVPQKIDIAKLDAVIVTHTHGDHAGGVEELAFRLKYQYPGRKVKLYGSDEVIMYLEAMLSPVLRASMECDHEVDTKHLPNPLFHFFDVCCLPCSGDGDGTPDIDCEDIRLTLYNAPHCHTLPAVSIEFDLHFSSGWKKIFWSGDTNKVNKVLTEGKKEYELVFHEVQFGHNPNGADVHTVYEDILDIDTTEIGTIVLMHLPSIIPVSDFPAHICLAEKGKTYTIL